LVRELPAVFTGTERFEPISLLGQGSMGVVYRALDREMGVDVALKTLGQRRPDQLYRLKQEFRIVSGVLHPNLVELYELFVDGAESFFTMELVEGRNFLDHVHGGQFDLGRFIAAVRQLAAGLSSLHQAGKLHRDVKPSNILVDPEGRVVLLDFGLAAALGSNGEAEIVGTMAYMAPEQAWGAQPHPAADWYGAGVVLYQSLTGRLPFDGSATQILMKKRSNLTAGPRSLAPHVPEEIDLLVRTLLDPDPTRRPDGEQILRLIDRLEAPAGASVLVRREPAATGSIPFVGRASELERMLAAFQSVVAGGTAVVSVIGPSGIGKTELVRRFLSIAERSDGALVLRGRCHHQEAVPYKAFDAVVDALSRFLLSSSPAELAALVPADAAAVGRLFPVLRSIPEFAIEASDGGAEPHEIRRRGFVALRALLSALAKRRRLVLWIDDLQWGDADSLTLMREILRPPEAPALLLVLSYRSEERGSSLLVELESFLHELPDGWANEIVLVPLDTRDSQSLAANLCVNQIDSDRRMAEIVAEAAGNPFFIVELAREPAHRRRPESPRLSDLIAGRVAELSQPARRLLEIVSVAGAPLSRSLALGAAGLGERARPLVSQLTQRALVRTAAGDQVALEVYHDRIREVLLASLQAGTLRDHHGALADSLLNQPEPDPEALFRHSLGAERREQAADWAVRAADRAAETLAFARAAELFSHALSLKAWKPQLGAELQVRQADALVNAGRGAEAAPIFLAASSHFSNNLELDLRRRAAEQYLVTGHIEEGTAGMRQLAEGIGVRFPQTPGGAVAATLARIVPLWLGRNTLRVRGRGRLGEAATRRIDTCHSAAKGLVLVDPVRGLYFAVLTLGLALRSGDQLRAARSLAAVGAALVPLGGSMSKWATRLLGRAREIAEASQDPYLLGFTAITNAQACMVEGRWRRMLELCDSGSDLLARHCRGVAWEVAIGRMAALRALEELGELKEWHRRSGQLLRESEEMGDVYGVVSGLLPTGLHHMFRGDFEAARAHARRVLATWTPSGFHMQHFYVLRLESYCDLGEGRSRDAWERIESAWPTLRRSGMLRHALMRTDAHLLRARAALSHAVRGPDAEPLLRIAEADAGILERQARPDAVAHALVVRSGIASIRGRRPEAVSLLEAATTRFEACQMALSAALAKSRSSELTAGAQKQHLGSESAEYFERELTLDPAALVAIYVPGPN
jgi:predicted Ser/Thr protein kinase